MKLTQIRNKVKMLLTELNMLILQFVVLMFFFYNIFQFYVFRRCFFYNIYNYYSVYVSVLLSSFSVGCSGGGISIGMISE